MKSETLRDFEFALPPLAEQRRIVVKLEELLGGRCRRASSVWRAKPLCVNYFCQAVKLQGRGHCHSESKHGGDL